ncbi:MAG: substrate-binding domain-containing protein [Prevotella sp.]|nr:substrate-binding domain-containing protein [Prevotella sp.]
MKKTRSYLIILYVFLLAACSGEKTYRIGFSQCAEGRWREKVNEEMLAAQHLFEHDAKVFIASAADDTQQQIRQIDSLVALGIDLLVVSPNESEPVSAAISRVRSKGIPVICFDRKVDGDNYTAFIGGSNHEAGHAIGVNVVDVAHGMMDKGRRKPLVLEITAQMSSSPAQERHQGFSQALQGHDELEYVWREGDWSSETTYRIVMEQIRTGRLPDIVFCHNDGMATGAYKAAVETKNEDKIKIFGIDGMADEGLDYVRFGHQVASYVYPTGGAEIVRLALDILTGKPYKRINTLQGLLVVRENAWSLIATTNEVRKQSRNLITIQDKLEEYLGLYNTQRKALWASAVLIVLLVIAVIVIWRARIQTQRTVRKRQELNEEQTLFYTDASRRKMAEIFSTSQENLPQPQSQDVLFAEQLNEAIRKNMSNPNLKMDELGEEIGLRRVQLYRRVKALTGVSPVELLRQMRLQQAYVLLSSTTKTVSEIAYEVGFNTPGYFSKCFKEQYGKLPMELRERSTKDT